MSPGPFSNGLPIKLLVRKNLNPVVLLVLAIWMFGGCSAGPRQFVKATRDLPVQINLPNYFDNSLSSKASGSLVEIGLPTGRSFTTNQIAISVRGEVISSGDLILPEGSTVFEAINAAGGFTNFAFSKEVRVNRGSTSVTLYLRKFASPGRGRLVRYDPMPHGKATTDHVLQDGDKIYVARALF
jgi:hypothetical protein